jgi:hypothetical protein
MLFDGSVTEGNERNRVGESARPEGRTRCSHVPAPFSWLQVANTRPESTSTQAITLHLLNKRLFRIMPLHATTKSQTFFPLMKKAREARVRF